MGCYRNVCANVKTTNVAFTTLKHSVSLKFPCLQKISLSSNSRVSKSGMVVLTLYQSCIRAVVPSLWDATPGEGVGVMYG